MDCYPQIRGIIAKELAMDEREVVPEAHLRDDLGADSLNLLSLAEAISVLYGITVLGDDLVDMENVGDLIRFVESKIP